MQIDATGNLTNGNAVARPSYAEIAKNIAENGIHKKPLFFLLATIAGLTALYVRQPETLLSGLKTIAFVTGAAWAAQKSTYYIAGKISKLNPSVQPNAGVGSSALMNKTQESKLSFNHLIQLQSNVRKPTQSGQQHIHIDSSSFQNLNISKDLGNFSTLPFEVLILIFNHIQLMDYSKTSRVCRTFEALTCKFLNTDINRSLKIKKIFKNLVENLKCEISPFPQTFKGNDNAFNLGPCLKRGGIILVLTGNEGSSHGYMKEGGNNLQQKIGTNHQWTMLPGIWDKEISIGDSNYSFFTNDGFDRTKLCVIDLLDGHLIDEIDPFQDLVQTDLKPPYHADDTRFITNFPKYNGGHHLYNGGHHLKNFNEGAGKELIGAHSFGNGDKILTVTRSGMVRKWAIDRNFGGISPLESPLKIFDAYAGSCHMDVERSWLTGKSLFVEVFTNEEWCFSKGKSSGKRTLLQYDISNNNLISQLPLSSGSYIAVNQSSIFVASFEGPTALPFDLKAYKIDTDTLNLNHIWSYPTDGSYRHFKSKNLAVNDKWVVFDLDSPNEIIILDANSGKVSAKIMRHLSLDVLLLSDVHLFEDLIVFRETTRNVNRIGIAHVLLSKIIVKDIPLIGNRVINSNHSEEGIKFKFDFKNMKFYGLLTTGNKQSLLEFSRL